MTLLRFLVLPLALLPLASLATAQVPGLLVSSRNGDAVLRYGADGTFQETFADTGNLKQPLGVTYGPDGHLYVVKGSSRRVLRYDGVTGEFIDSFVDDTDLTSPRNANFGPDGHLYVADGTHDRIHKYDGATGAALGIFAEHPLLDGPTSFTFGPDGDLYAVAVNTHRVLRFDGQSGAFVDEFITQGLMGPHDLAFGPDGDLYVVNAFAPTGGSKVGRYDGVTGAFVGAHVTAAGLNVPLGITFGIDGHLYLANQGNDNVRRFHGVTGAPMGNHVATGAGGLDGPTFFLFEPAAGGLAVLPPPSGAGADVIVSAAGAQPGGLVALLFGQTPLATPLGVCGGATLGIADAQLVGHGMADEGGYLVLRRFAPPGLAGATVQLQAIDLTACRSSPVVAHTF